MGAKIVAVIQEVLLVVYGAGGSHRTAILWNDGQVRRPVVFRKPELWLVVVHGMCGIIRNLFPHDGSIWSGGHVLDQLLEENNLSWLSSELC